MDTYMKLMDKSFVSPISKSREESSNSTFTACAVNSGKKKKIKKIKKIKSKAFANIQTQRYCVKIS
jgi:hypothetical protein